MSKYRKKHQIIDGCCEGAGPVGRHGLHDATKRSSAGSPAINSASTAPLG
jgi:hypothetical protein